MKTDRISSGVKISVLAELNWVPYFCFFPSLPYSTTMCGFYEHADVFIL